MLKTPHDWNQLRAMASVLRLRVLAHAKPEDRLAELRAERAAVMDEARGILDKYNDDGENVTPEEDARLVELIGEKGDGGRNDELLVEIHKIDNQLSQRRALAMDAEARGLETDGRVRRGTEPSGGVLDSPIRDATTGKPVAMASAGKPFFSNGDEGSAPDFGKGVVAQFKGEASPDGAVFEGGDSGGNYWVNPASTGILLDKMLSLDVMSRAGVRDFAMTSPEMTVLEVLENPTGSFRPELGMIEASRPSFGQKKLSAKSAACAIVLSEELMADSANAASVVQETAAAAMANLRAEAILRGAGTDYEPLGVLSNPNIHAVDAVGFPADYTHLSSAVGKVLQSDFPGSPSELAVIHHPRDAEVLDQLQDSTGQPLQPSPWVNALSMYTTTALRTDLGTGTDESEALLGHFPSVLVGTRQALQARMVDAGTMKTMSGETYEAPSQLVKYLILTMRFDILVTRPKFFVSLNGIEAAAP